MQFACVIGNVVATRKEEKVRGRKSMVIQPLNIDFEPEGNVQVGVDAAGAGEGEVVLYARGSSARQTHFIEETSGIPHMALDKNIDAGVGDTVLMIDDGGSARLVLEDDMAPVRCVVIGLVDDVNVISQYVPTS